ncbi:hypothetical protein [Pedobacter sp. GR22-6]|uniref:hypothetical protein n=1 Tax=Pedobacter sp. GR22-6 TaxID=3127957 RepID=UPI00307D871F
MIIILCYSCGDKCSDQKDMMFISNSSIRIVYRTASNGFLIKDKGGVYLPSDISVYDENNQKVSFSLQPRMSEQSGDYYVLSIYFLNDKSPAPGRYNERKVFVDFKTTTDVFELNFNIKRLDCGDILEYMNVKYNGVQAASINNGYDVEFEVVK